MPTRKTHNKKPRPSDIASHGDDTIPPFRDVLSSLPGLRAWLAPHPALKGWAILCRPYRD